MSIRSGGPDNGVPHNCRSAPSPRNVRIGHPDDVAVGVGRGVVFIAWIDDDGESGFYSGYWDGGGRGAEGLLEQMPETSSTREALDWACARSDRVRIRPRWDPARYYSAGSLVDPELPPFREPDE